MNWDDPRVRLASDLRAAERAIQAHERRDAMMVAAAKRWLAELEAEAVRLTRRRDRARAAP
jgi:hypothetical protein